MADITKLEQALPVAPLKIAALDSAAEMGRVINEYLVAFRKETHKDLTGDPAFQGYHEENYLASIDCPRFGSGESKGIFNESVRGKDLYILLDVCNHSITYKMNGYINHKSPDDHYQDLKRVIAATGGKAYRINVIMPFLYESRQHKRNGRESLDCAYALKELSNMGVSNIITFDAHDPRVQNSVPLCGFDSFMPTYQFTKALLEAEPDIIIDKEHTIVLSPDEGALDRAIYFASVLGVDVGMFYKRRDYSTVINGKNPIVAHEFLGDNIAGKDAIIVDDMISSGESMIDTARMLKEFKVRRLFICTTFGLFTNGLALFDEAYEKGYFDRLITTNLTYQTPELLSRPYYMSADMNKFLASIIDFMNHNVSLNFVRTPTAKIRKLMMNHNRKLREEK
ncbi:MAG: ribose-phosphate pyrophosphokinase [Lachnospiraceae bacterium]|nr:ribose-phosphate pyrophosphokinase [Lachnospiraceae bacterium]